MLYHAAGGFLAGGLNFWRTWGEACAFQGDKAGGVPYFSRSRARLTDTLDEVGVSFFFTSTEYNAFGVNIPPLLASIPYLGVAD